MNVDLDALFADASREEVAAVWESMPREYRADGFELLDEPIEADGAVAQFLRYRSEGLRIYGALYRPAEGTRGPFPLLMANHGGFGGLGRLRAEAGPRDAGDAGDTDQGERRPGVRRAARRPFQQWCWDLARQGYVVLASGYRGEHTPLGLSDGGMEGGRGEVTDVLNLMECGKTLPYVDVSRIGMWGTSHGGWITALAAQRSADVRAGIVYFAPADICFRGARRVGGDMREQAQALMQKPPPVGPVTAVPGEAQSVVARAIFGPLARGEATVEQTRREMIARTVHLFAERTRCPLFIVCGDADGLYQHSIDLDAALARAGKEHEFRVFPGEGHGFTYTGSQQAIDAAWTMTLDFFDRRLR